MPFPSDPGAPDTHFTPPSPAAPIFRNENYGSRNRREEASTGQSGFAGQIRERRRIEPLPPDLERNAFLFSPGPITAGARGCHFASGPVLAASLALRFSLSCSGSSCLGGDFDARLRFVFPIHLSFVFRLDQAVKNLKLRPDMTFLFVSVTNRVREALLSCLWYFLYQVPQPLLLGMGFLTTSGRNSFMPRFLKKPISNTLLRKSAARGRFHLPDLR